MYPSIKSGMYSIHLKGESNPAAKVHCDMTTKNGVGVTEIGHDSQSRIKVVKLTFIYKGIDNARL